MRILNATGCLDALAAPDVARQLDAFVTKTVTPLPREGNAPPRIAETAHGMLNAIGLANPGRERFLADHLPRLRELGDPALGLRRRLLRGRLRGDVRAPRPASRRSSSTSRARTSTRPPTRRRRSSPPAARRRALPLYAKLSAAHPGRRGGRARGRRRGRRRALAHQHAPRHSRSTKHAPPGARARQRRPLRPGAEAGRARTRCTPATRRRGLPIVGMGGIDDRAATRSSSSRAARATSRSARCSSRIPTRRRACAPSSPPRARTPALPSPDDATRAWQKARKPSEKSAA